MTRQQTSLSSALDLPLTGSQKCHVQLSTDICMGAVNQGGYVTCVMAKYARVYASQHPRLNTQLDVRSVYAQFYRPIFPEKGGVTLTLREVSVGKSWSTLRVELMQGEKIGASADFLISNLAIPGISQKTSWSLNPPLRPVDLTKLESDSDPNWAGYQTAFYPHGFRRARSYMKGFIPRSWPVDATYIEQWMAPGWDCDPVGSRITNEADKAKWTNEMIPFAVDTFFATHDGLLPLGENQALPLASVRSILKYSADQKEARDAGKPNWREINDGAAVFNSRTTYVTISMAIEIKKKLPDEGVRWLCLRTESKKIEQGRMDLTVLCFDETMDLVAISSQIGQLIPAAKKIARPKASL